ncbi:hypothetical protein ACROYT_G034173 [Oculina patagonica]
MDQTTDISRRTESAIALNSVNEQTMEAIESVANKLAIIGDELSQSYEGLSDSGAKLAKARPCAALEESEISLDSVNEQTMEAIESVANKLAIIGDELSQSYEELSDSGVKLSKARSCATLECCLDILLSVLKA